ncbi:MAG: YeeE/YedE family protein, partial [Rhodobacteraceae bacterium]|nr:YeeE/YedE family protein [Paracoccaceae bacterium]
MFESLGFESYTAPQVAVGFALLLGLAYGLLAERTGFCLRRSLIGEDRRAAAGVWLSALLVALIGTQAIAQAGLISFDDHRFFAADLPLLAIIVGGLLFGAGMVLTRGCASRLTVLTGTGNLRALTVILVFALTAHATLKGVLSSLRTGLGAITVPLETATLPGNPLLWTALIAVAAIALILRSGNRPRALLGGALIGALVPLAWVGTGYVLYDDFDPIALQGLSFTAPAADTLFFTAASTAVSANFGVGLIAGVTLGALVASLVFGS